MKDEFHERLRRRRSDMKRRLCYVLLVLLFGAVLLGTAFVRSDAFQRQYVYPYPYRPIIAHYAKVYGVEDALVAGVILGESKFRDEVRSHRGAVGLMQIMPETAEWIAGQIGLVYDMEKLHEPETNIRFGIWYLSSLQREFQGNEVLVLAAYNAGRGTVRSWMEEYGWDESFADASRIPYGETREYVTKVLKNKESYRKLYDGE